MKTKSLKILYFSLLLLAASCAPRLVGTWSVQNYETVRPANKGISLQNVGTISFDKDGTGQKMMNYSVLGIERDESTPFKWSATETYITIEGTDDEISKTWIYLENKNKSQKWKSTDGKNQVQTLELVKQ
ncbi:MAG TPA: hypothetical protein ENH60_01410 [Pricia sp.]|uniref:Lipocalin-like domain-containing protein n=1 Tax=Pricia antarctica TaxID=641691 RepID=A0A831QPU4_9FLAO|nr:hypothetical protein [Pricia sp.]HEA20541.1 hypothetical protein [Pricia antarctica]